MRLSPDSHKLIERFLREHLRQQDLMLPPLVIYSGSLARWITRSFHILAITFGRRIFVAPKVLVRDSSGRLTVPGSLIAHEAAHVVQYAQAGFAGFLFSYLREYRHALKAQEGIGTGARQAAYRAIKHEQEAYDAEHAFTGWVPGDKAEL